MLLAAAIAACAPVDGELDAGPEDEVLTEVSLENIGSGDMEGHTPRGFQGQGTGLFIGDNLNPNFPDGDGVHAYISFLSTRSPRVR